MEKDETFRYIQNLVCFPMFKYLNEKNELWKPNAIYFNIDIKNKYEFKHILYLIDVEENLSSNDIIKIKKIELNEFNIEMLFILSILNQLKKYYH